MFWDFIKSYKMMLNCVWDPAGVLMTIGIFFLIWEKRRTFWRDYRFYLFAAGILGAFLWRTVAHVNGSRYYGVMVLPALFFSFFLFRHIPVGNRLKTVIFSGALLACFAMNFWYNPEEKNVLELYRSVSADAGKYPNSLLLSFAESTTRESFYTGLPVYGTDRPVPTDKLLENLKNNYSLFDGDHDAVYFFIEARKKQTQPPEVLPEKFQLVGKTFVDRHHKKMLYAYRYLPGKEQFSIVDGELLPNGDFSAVSGKVDDSVSRRAIRFADNAVGLPDKWRIYHSLLGKSYAFAQVVKTPDGNALQLNADSYIAVFSPEFEQTSDRTINFKVDAQSDCALQISHSFNDKNHHGIVVPVITLKIAAGTSRRYSVKLAQQENSTKSSVIFWLQNGTLNISDVRVK